MRKSTVIPAQAGIQFSGASKALDPRLRGDDGKAGDYKGDSSAGIQSSGKGKALRGRRFLRRC